MPPCYAVFGVFNRHYRKVKAIFGVTDVLLTSMAFMIAYETRVRLHFENKFFIDFPMAALLLVVSAFVLRSLLGTGSTYTKNWIPRTPA